MHADEDARTDDAADARPSLPLQQPSAVAAILAGTTSATHLLDALQHTDATVAPATRVERGGSSANEVDEAEVLFLIADYLKRRSKCTKAADVLIEELTEHRLLRDTIDWQGTTKPSTYADYRLRHRDIAPTHLLGLMQNVTNADAAAASGVDASSATPRGASTPRGLTTPRGSFTARIASTPRSGSTPRSARGKTPALGATAPRSLLLKSRLANQRLQLPLDERKALAKDIVTQLFALRANLRTQRVVERVVHKYERLREYTAAASIDDLPLAVRNELLSVPSDALAQQAEHVTSLAADVRALRQLLQLKHAQRVIDAKMRAMMARATHAALFESRVRTGRNQLTLLARQQVRPATSGTLPPPFVYSRMRRLKTLCGHLQIRAFCLTYDKTGKFVITGADDRLVKIWSLATGDLLFTLRGHVGNITDLAVNSANTLLASSSDDKTVRVWELSTGAPVAVLLGHSSIVNAVRFHPTKNVVVTASNDGRCFCYTLPDIPSRDAGAEPETKLQTAQRLNRLKAYLLSLHPVFSLTPGALRQGVRSCKVLCLSFSRCGKYVITGSQDGVGRVWDVSVFSGSNAPVSTSQYQHEGELQLNVDDTAAAATDVQAPDAPQAPRIPAPAADAAPAPAPDAAPPLLPLPLLPLEPLQPLQPLMSQNRDANVLGTALVDGTTAPLAAPAAVPVAPLLPLNANAVQSDAAAPAPQDGVTPLDPLPLPLAVEPPQRQQTQLPQLPQTGAVPVAAIPDVDIPSLPAKEPIALLQGHTGPITNIVYSNDGERIATASIKDGTTRIWQWDKKHKKLHHTVLLADEPDDDDEALASLYGVQPRKRAAPAVDTLSWSHDDRRLITLHSVKPDSHAPDAVWKQRVRVWDPVTGKLVLTLAAVDKDKQHGHTNAVFVMDVHPTDWRIVVTAGYDGRIFLWDIATGTMLKAFTNVSPDAELVPMLDGGFIPNGQGFCFTDRIGRLLIFGTGSGEQYAATPVQQYFPSDYAALITDRHFNVLDRETQQIPSMMDTGPLVDIYQIEYPYQPPHLMRASANFTPAQRTEHRRQRIMQATESEIKCRVRHALEDKTECEVFPSAVLRVESIRARQLLRAGRGDGPLATASYRLNGAPVALSELRRRHTANNGRRRSAASLDERDTSILNMEISSEDDHSDEDFQAPTRSTRQNDDDDDDDEDDDDDDDDEDDEEDELDEDDFPSDDDDESPRFRRRRQARAAASTGRAPSFPRRGGRRLRESPPATNTASDDDDDDDAPRRRTRRLASAAEARRRRVVVASDDESSGSSDGGRRSRRAAREQARTDADDADAHGSDDRRSSRGDSIDDSRDDVVVETNDGFIMGDNQLDKFDRSVTYAQLLAAKQQQLGTTRGNTADDSSGSEVLIPCAFCHGGDDGGVLKLPGDSMGEHPLVNGTQRLFVHDQCAIASPLCFNRGGKWYNVTKEIRRGRSLACVECKKRGATVGCTVPSCPKSYHWKCAISCGWSMNQMHFYCPTHESMRTETEADSGSGAGASDDPVTKRFGHTFHRDWLQKLTLATTQSYVPQVGDYVTYFPHGHSLYMRVFPVRDASYVARLRPFFAVKCRVVDVRYVFPTLQEYAKCSSIKCEISLVVLAAPTSAFQARTADATGEEETKSNGDNDAAAAPVDVSTMFDAITSPFASFTGVDAQLEPATDDVCERFGFTFQYHPHDVSNFVVLDHVYENGVRGGWQVGERVEMPLVELDEHGSETGLRATYGVITGFLAQFLELEGDRRVLTPWECVQVDWEDSDLDGTNVGPWEIEPVAGSPRRAAKQQLEHQRRECALFRSRSVVGAKRAVLLQELDTIRNLSISRDFLYPVDSSFLDYVLTVANPVDLTKIQQRVRSGYYRQVEAFIADAQLLCINCETYNVPTSSIAQNSRSIYAALLSQVLRHFPSLLRGENWDPQGDCRVFSYPPNAFLDGFPDDGDDDGMMDALPLPLEDSSVATGAGVAAAAESLPSAPANASSPSPARDAATSHVHASPVRHLRRSAPNSLDAAGTADSESTASPFSGANRPRSKSDEIKAVLSSISKQIHSPAPAVKERTPRGGGGAVKRQPLKDVLTSPARLGSRIRTTSTTSTASASDTPSRANKRRRQQPRVLAAAKSARALSTIDGLIDLDGLLEMLTSAQRDVFERQCDDDLPQVLRDFHEALSQLDVHSIFAAPVTEEVAPGYFSVITNPMDFGTMGEKIDDEYQDFAEYFDDLYLTLSNAITFNTWEGFVGDTVKELQEHFVKFLLDAVGGGKPDPSLSRKKQKQSSGPTSASATTTALSKKKQKAKAKSPAAGKRKLKQPRGRSRSRSYVVSDDDDDDDDDEDDDDDDDESVNSASDARDDEEEEEEEEEEEVEEDTSDDTGDESDWGGGARGRKRQQQQHTRAAASSSKRRRA